MAETRKRARLFSSIKTRDDALQMINDAAIGFFLVAGVQAGVLLFTQQTVSMMALIYALLAVVLLKWKSRVVAILLLVVAATSLIMIILNLLGVLTEGDTNLVLTLLLLWVAIRAVEATHKLHSGFTTPPG
jgi:hypothetical protein